MFLNVHMHLVSGFKKTKLNGCKTSEIVYNLSYDLPFRVFCLIYRVLVWSRPFVDEF